MTMRFLRDIPARVGGSPSPPGAADALHAPAKAERRSPNPLRLLPEVPRDRLAGTWREARPARI